MTNRPFIKGLSTLLISIVILNIVGINKLLKSGSNSFNNIKSFIAEELDSNSWNYYNDLNLTRHIEFGGNSATTTDGGTVVAAYSSNPNYTELMQDVVKTDNTGNIDWVTIFNGIGLSDVYPLVLQKSDGGYIAAGSTYSFRKHNNQVVQDDAWFVILNQDGTLNKGKFITGKDNINPYSLFQTTDNNYIIAGAAYGYFDGAYNHWIMKISANGDILWSKVYNIFPYSNGISDGVASDDGGGVFIGYYSNQAIVTKVNGNGDIEDQKLIINQTGDGYLNRIVTTPDGGYLISGSQAFVKLDSNLNYSYAYLLQTDFLSVYERSVALDNNGRFLFVGSKRSGLNSGPAGFTAEIQVSEESMAVLNETYYKDILDFYGVSKSDTGYRLSGIPGSQSGGLIFTINDPNLIKPACLLAETVNFPLNPIIRTVAPPFNPQPEVNHDLENHTYPINDPNSEYPNLNLTVEVVAYTGVIKADYCKPSPTDTCTPTYTPTSTLTPTATLTPTPPYIFTGFFPPVDNLPIINITKAGSAIPLKFSLGGDFGLGIFASGYPSSSATTCGSSAEDAIEETVSANSSGLKYDATTSQYSYVWKTSTAWSGTCRTLVLKFTNGSIFKADFKFK
jgi:hypothetical protein